MAIKHCSVDMASDTHERSFDQFAMIFIRIKVTLLDDRVIRPDCTKQREMHLGRCYDCSHWNLISSYLRSFQVFLESFLIVDRGLLRRRRGWGCILDAQSCPQRMPI